MSVNISVPPKVGKIFSSQSLIESKKVSLKNSVSSFFQTYKRRPRLAVILIGDDPASVLYTTKKGELAIELGMEHETLHFPHNVSPEEVKAAVLKLNDDPATDGILIQRPLPKQFSESEVVYWVKPIKDVDAFHPYNLGALANNLAGHISCTPKGILDLLKHHQVELAGKHCVIVGRSTMVGKPLGLLLLRENATVTYCHSHSCSIQNIAKLADLLIVAAGRPHLVNKTWIKNGAIIVDVGIHRRPSEQGGGICGDVDADDVFDIVSAITPVPGGVGPMTVIALMENTLNAAHLNQKKLNF